MARNSSDLSLNAIISVGQTNVLERKGSVVNYTALKSGKIIRRSNFSILKSVGKMRLPFIVSYTEKEGRSSRERTSKERRKIQQRKKEDPAKKDLAEKAPTKKGGKKV